MYATKGYDQYKTMQAQTADRGELVVMLYQGAIKFLGRASAALEAGMVDESHENLVRVQDIIAELMGSLNLETGEIAQNLFRLYEYMHFQLVQANILKDSKPVIEVTALLRDLLPAWQQAARAARTERSGERNAAPARLSLVAG